MADAGAVAGAQARAMTASLLLLAAALAAPPVGALPDQPIPSPSPRVDGGEFARRLLSPLEADDVARFVAAGQRRLAPEPFVPGEDRVDLHVPPDAPAAGYGLLVFVPPADDFPIPRDWLPVLARRGIVLAVPRGVGNEVDVIGRRIPRVLNAQAHVAARWRIDPARTYVGGFSGGARLAQRIALAWPDVFAGSLQFAGSVVVGENRLPPPPAGLAARARGNSRFVLVSGTLDGVNRRNDGLARERLQALCFAGVRGFVPPRLDHWVPDGRGLSRALDLLEAPVAADPACEAALDARLAGALDAVEARLDAGDAEGARNALVALDDFYGGLAAPRSLALAGRIRAALPALAD